MSKLIIEFDDMFDDDWHEAKERSKRDQESNRRIQEEGERLQDERDIKGENDDWWNPWR